MLLIVLGHVMSCHSYKIVRKTKVICGSFLPSSALNDTFCMQKSVSDMCTLVTWSVCCFMLQAVTSIISDNILLCHIVLQTWFWSSWNEVVRSESDYCQINWWTNLLFINNYVNSHHMVSTVTTLSSQYTGRGLLTSMCGISKFLGGENVTAFR